MLFRSVRPGGLLDRVDRYVRRVLVGVDFPLANRIVCISDGLAGQVGSLPFIRKNKVEVIYNPAIGRNFDERLSLPAVGMPTSDVSGKVILSVGRLHRQKDYPTLLRALRLVNQAVNVTLVILGDGEDRQKLEQLAIDLGVSDRVIWMGHVRNPLQIGRAHV